MLRIILFYVLLLPLLADATTCKPFSQYYYGECINNKCEMLVLVSEVKAGSDICGRRNVVSPMNIEDKHLIEQLFNQKRRGIQQIAHFHKSVKNQQTIQSLLEEYWIKPHHNFELPIDLKKINVLIQDGGFGMLKPRLVRKTINRANIYNHFKTIEYFEYWFYLFEKYFLYIFILSLLIFLVLYSDHPPNKDQYKHNKLNDTKGLIIKFVFLIISAASIYYYRYQLLHLFCFFLTSIIIVIDLAASLTKKFKANV